MAFSRPRPSFQPCETFFVEDDYHRVRAERQAKQEHDKLVARERQYVIADQLSRLTSEELRDDVVKHMLEMDVSSLLYQHDRFGVKLMLLFTGSNSPRCGINRYSNRDPMVHASVPP